MKKLILLGLLTMITCSAYAQIEGFDEMELTTQQVQNEQFDKSMYITPNSNRLELGTYTTIQNLLERKWDSYDNQNVDYSIYDIRNEQIFSTLNTKGIKMYQEMGYNIPKKFILSMDNAMQTLSVEIFKSGEYYDVVDILITEEEFAVWKTKINNCKNFVGDTVHRMVRNPFGEKLTPIKITQKDVLDRFYKIQLPSESKYTKTIILPNGEVKKPSREKFTGNAVYVLKKGEQYYLVSRSVTTDGWKGSPNIVNIEHMNKMLGSIDIIGTLVTIDDFISVKGFNTMKKIFENKVLTTQTDTTKCFLCKKIAPKDGIIQGLFENLSTNQTIFRPITTYGVAPLYWDFEHEMASGASKEDIGDFSYNVHVLSNHYCIKDELDSVLNIREMKQIEKERIKNMQKAEEQKRIINAYGEKFGQLIIEGEICLGMTKEMCKEAKGTPCQANSSQNEYAKIEVWTYNCMAFEYGLSNLLFVTFTDGKITEITK